MIAPLEIEKNETILLQAYYEKVAHDTLRILWRRRLLIAATLVAGFLLGSIAVVLIGPRYTGVATIQLNFSREEPAAGTKIQSIALMDPVTLVDSAADVIRSRATASAVVARLGLDKDPGFARESTSLRLLSSARTALGLDGATPSPRDLAVKELMGKVTVTNQPRSYLISIAVTTGDPERAAVLANAVALEYLRGQITQQLTEAQAAVERELAELSSVYGVRHPNYVLGRKRLADLQARVSALRDGSPAEDAVKLVMGQSFVAAEKVMIPSGPNIVATLGLTVGIALALGIGLALLGPTGQIIRHPERTDLRAPPRLAATATHDDPAVKEVLRRAESALR
jgi:capsular polysaccharide biosynthesis protein